jgi:hypothetical protein
VDSAGRSRFVAGPISYERFGYTLSATFLRASRNVILEFHFRNEASDAMFPPWTDDVVSVKEVSWQFPFSFEPADRAIFAGGDNPLSRLTAPSAQIEQRKGAGTPWVRRARLLVNGIEAETNTAFASPMLAIGDGRYAVSAHIPWLRFREPQALAAAGSTLSFQFISEAQVVGEAKGIWNWAKLSLDPVRNGWRRWRKRGRGAGWNSNAGCSCAPRSNL